MNAIKQLKNLAQRLNCLVKEQEPLCRYTTFRIGGPADLLLEVPSQQVLSEVITQCRSTGTPYTVLGNGSNVLVPDEGIRGVVLVLQGEFQTMELLPEGQIL